MQGTKPDASGQNTSAALAELLGRPAGISDACGMSAAGRSAAALTGHVRHADDFYATPSWCTRALLGAALQLRPKMSILEPAAGEGAIVAEVQAARSQLSITAVEIDPGRHLVLQSICPQALCANFLEWRPKKRFDLVVTNPPFALAMDFVEASFELMKPDGECAMLLRLNWLASMKRARFLQAHCPDVYVLPRRPSFTGGGTDATDYGWFVWRGTAIRETGQLRVLPITELHTVSRTRSAR